MNKETSVYNLAAIRELLQAAFTADDLRRFCLDRPLFRRLVDSFGAGDGLDRMVDRLVEYCDKRLLFDELLAEVRQANLRQYERFASQLRTPTDMAQAAAGRSGPLEPHAVGPTVLPPAVVRPINLSFDGPTAGYWPSGWFNSFGYVGGVSTGYEIRVIPREGKGTGACVLFQNPTATADQFGSLMQRCPAHYLAGRVVRFEGEVKTQDVEQWAGLWFRADGTESELFFDNMHRRPIVGTTPWKSYNIDAQLPEQTAWINYGILLVGRGIMWADNFRLLVWENGTWRPI